MKEENQEYKFTQQKMAIERTVLANERTFLAYSRSAMALLVAGLSFLHFANSIILSVVGILFIPISGFTFIFGLLRFKKVQKSIRQERHILESYCKS